MDVVFGDDQMRARTDHAAQNFAVLRQFVLNLLRLAPVKRKGGLKVQRLIAATSDTFRAELLGLKIIRALIMHLKISHGKRE
jgi:hypothetical protein